MAQATNQKEKCHVHDLTHRLESHDSPPPACDWRNLNFEPCNNHRFRLATDRSRDLTSAYTSNGLALESLRLPMPRLAGEMHVKSFEVDDGNANN
jgi:hypothetical protein